MKENKISHEWSVLCSKSILDKDTNNLSLINLIEQIGFDVQLTEGSSWDESVGEVFQLEMVLVSRFRKLVADTEVVSFDTKIDFVSPEGKIIASYEQPVEMGQGMDNIRARYGIGGLRITKEGMYQFVVNTKEQGAEKYKKLYSVPLKIGLNFV